MPLAAPTSSKIETHGDALRLALRTMADVEAEHCHYYRAEQYDYFGSANKEEALAKIRDLQDAMNAIRDDMLPEEERWESENGYSDEEGNRIPEAEREQ